MASRKKAATHRPAGQSTGRSTGRSSGRPARRPASGAGVFAYDGLDRVLHEKARLGILTALLNQAQGLRFTELKELCSLTDGNLSRHIQVLLDAGLIEVWKGKEEGRPQTLVRISKPGRKQFIAYLAELERVIRDAAAAQQAGEAGKLSSPPGWAPA